PTWNPVVEMLEDRIVLSSSTATWTGADHAISDNWSDVANWVGDYKPQAGDAVVFPATAVDFNPINDNPAGTIFASITIQSGDYDITGNAVELTGPLTANSNADGALYELSTKLDAGKIEVVSGSTLYCTGQLSGSAGLEEFGGGTLSLRGRTANTYTGTTTVDDGTLYLDNIVGRYAIPGSLVIGAKGTGAIVHESLSFQINPGGSSVTLNNGSIFDLDGGQETIGPLALNGSTDEIYTATTDGTQGGLLTLESTLTVSSGANATINGNISFGAADDSVTVSSGANATINGNISFGTADRTFDVDGSLSLNATVSGTGALNKIGIGKLTLDGGYLDPGAVNINDGTLFLIYGSYDSSSTAGITVASGATLELYATGTISEPIHIAGTGSNGTGAISDNYGGDTLSNVTLTGNATVSSSGALPYTDLIFSGAIGDGSSGYSLTANGPGLIDLRGNNTYTGGTFVTGGLLYIEGSVLGTTTVNAGGQLGGHGSFGDVVTSGGTVGAGGLSSFNQNIPDTEIANVASLTLNSSATFQAQANSITPGSGYSQVIVSGAVALNGATLSLPSYAPNGNAFVPGSSLTLIKGATSLTGTFNGLPEGAILYVAGVKFKITYQGGAGGLDVVLNRFASTTTTLTVPTTSSVYSQPVTFTATVVTVPSGGSPTGTVTFFKGSTNLGTGMVDGSGDASITTTILPVGNDAITATYSGDSIDDTSTASAVTQQVFQDTTTSTVTSSVTPSVFGQSVTITATVAANTPGTGMGDGTVIFYDGTTPVASNVTLVGGHATFN